MELDLAGMHQLAIEQGIDLEQLDAALEEALRLAYLKTPHAAKLPVSNSTRGQARSPCGS